MDAFNIKDCKGITQDSRKVGQGYLFAALPGSKVDGLSFIPDALDKGARAVLVQSGVKLGNIRDGINVISDDNPRRRFSQMAAEYYVLQPDYSVAVTGTNGKTSTVHFARQIWAALGYKAASLGTLGVQVSGANVSIEKSGSMTTPDPVTLHQDLKTLKEAGIDHLAMEASSHGLDQYRLDGVKIRAAGFTGFSRDHLDYHASEAEYLAAKMRLFSEVCVAGGAAVLNADISEFPALEKTASDRGLTVWSYGRKGREFKILDLKSVPEGQALSCEVLGKSYNLILPLAGEFQVYNVLCALGLVLSEDQTKASEALNVLSTLTSVPGRIEFIAGHPVKAGVYVDYAHTPDAIETVLKALRPHALGKLVCIFGCGGDRDPGKRPLMGKAALDNADIVIVTDDNPRSEDPASIRAQAAAASDEIINIEGRREAIRYALSLLQENDVLVVTGKGHEQGQEFADHTEEFCDATELRKAMGILTEEKKS